MMNWPQLLSARRLASDKAGAPRRTPFQIDHDRIVFSSAFRRLQDKTQVFPLAESDFVRTRLTHSLEVSCVARSLGEQVGATICERHDLGKIGVHQSDIGAICAAAALAHDLGNPPFGHSGEDAIRHWFRASHVAEEIRVALAGGQLLDIGHYEGNAQAFRVVTELQMPDNKGGMELTCATLGALAKYPVEAPVAFGKDKPPGASAKKFNFFQSEKQWFAEVAEVTGLIPRRMDAAAWCRHPLAFLVEAADDICYHIIDFEDAYRHGLIGYEEIKARFAHFTGGPKIGEWLAKFGDPNNAISALRAMAINSLVEEAVQAFLQREEALLAGEFDQPLTDVIASAPAFAELKERSITDIYSNREVIATEIAGFEVIGGLLDVFVGAANEAARGGAVSSRSRKTLKLVPTQFIGPDRKLDADPYARLLRLLDFVAGMTDSYAVALFKQVRGISL
jgi:dGTPase